jgi:adenine-specific DNA-methyltransferase
MATRPRRPNQRRGEPLSRETPDLTTDLLKELRQAVPGAFTDQKLDVEKLQALLGQPSSAGPERFTFTWAGRQDSSRILQMATRASLYPRRDLSSDFDKTGNMFIEGDNLEVLKLLYKPFFGRVKLIFIDPPYNTGNDVVYQDDYADPLRTYLKFTGQADSEGHLLSSNPETNGRYHSTWLSMMYPRLFLAKYLLKDDGMIFVSIDDHEDANLKLLMNEVFGEENFVASVAWEKRFTRSNNAKLFSSVKDTILVYRRSGAVEVLREKRTEKSDSTYGNPDGDSRGPWTSVSYVNPATKAERPNLVYQIVNPVTGAEVSHPTNAWKYARAQHETHVRENRLYWGKDGGYTFPRLKKFLSDVKGGLVPIDLWKQEDTGTTDEGSRECEELVGRDVFDNPKPTRLLRRILALATSADGEDLVLDFFAGSCTTAQAVLEANRADGGNRRFIMVQLPQPTPGESAALKQGFATLSQIGSERIRRVIKRLRHEDRQKLVAESEPRDQDLGFRFLSLGQSNFRSWNGVGERTIAAWTQAMREQVDPLAEGWKQDDVVLEIAIREGLTPVLDVQRLKEISDNVVLKVGDRVTGRQIHICLDAKIKPATIRSLRLAPEDVFVSRDLALDDTAAANLALQCRLKTI